MTVLFRAVGSGSRQSPLVAQSDQPSVGLKSFLSSRGSLPIESVAGLVTGHGQRRNPSMLLRGKTLLMGDGARGADVLMNEAVDVSKVNG